MLDGAHAVDLVVRVTNTGGVAGRETAQLYVRFPPSADEPELLLRGFAKTNVLAPGANATVAFRLGPPELSIWEGRVDDHTGRWTAVHGEFEASVGASSRDHRLRAGFVY